MAETNWILVPLDGSKVAENAVPAAGWLAGLYGAELRFIHVLDGDVDRADAAGAGESFTAYAEEAAGRNGTSAATAEVVRGPAAEAILKASEGAKFVVIASRGRGGVKAMFVGSVADKVVRGAKLPVLMVPGVERAMTPDATKPVLIAVDGSEAAERGLVLGREIAAKAKSPVALVRAFTLPPPAGIEFAAYPVNLLETIQEAAQEYLANTAKPGEQTYLTHGDATTAIVEVAGQIDARLVVMASTGKGLARRLAMGSTTNRVMHTIERPVLILPAAD